ncbi:MAG: S8 family serine peptidase [Bdellovibrionaceae bacterium]|nr:S8 family serine peptidase [Pseudobdellovibrionaceae bacterium]
MKTTQWLLMSVLFLATLGCREEVDDQTIVQGPALNFVNPAPSKRNFLQNNQRHKVIVAAIDSGTDYNHPQLLNNMHFTLDENSQPVGLGYDFIGQDYWPSPYIARTLDINPDADQKDVPPSRNAREQATRISAAYPELAAYLNPLRNVEQEFESGAFHGTHVSGLMVHDDPRIGLLAYRVLPINIKYKNGRQDLVQDKTAIAFNNILQAMAMAVKAGARVINMSLALKGNPAGDNLFNIFEDSTKKQKVWMAQVKDFMDRNPNVIFVAAAGNESKWVDDNINLQLPCGISARNLVCVGALDKNEKLAYFSNLVLSQAAFVAASGVDIESSRPTLMCDTSFLSQLKNEKTEYPYNNPSSLNYAIKQANEDCVGKAPIRKASGTSMASPAVARVVAKLVIEHPNLSGEEIIKLLVDGSEKLQLGPLLLNKVKTDKPSWSKN